MNASVLVAVLLVLSTTGYVLGRARALRTVAGDPRRLHSLPSYYGLYIALWVGIPGLVLLLLWLFVQPMLVESMVLSTIPGYEALSRPQKALLLTDVRNLSFGSIVSRDVDASLRVAADRYVVLNGTGTWMLVAVGSAIAAGTLALTWRHVGPAFRARNAVERIVRVLLISCSAIAVLTTIGIVLSLLFESLRFFSQVSLDDFLFGLRWSPQTALRADQVGSSGTFGAVPLFTGTLLIAAIAMVVAIPIGLYSAVFLSEYANAHTRAIVKPVMEILAGVPTVVYGFFAILTIAPVVRGFGEALGINASANSALAAGLVMGIMIVPFISSLSDDIISQVPQALRDGSYALGATRAETIRQVVLPAALPGIVGSILLAVSRAIGETMIVVMAAGLAANLTANPFAAVTTVTVQIATLLVGDQEFDSAKTLSVFALGLVLFVVTLCLNIFALKVVQKYREKYD